MVGGGGWSVNGWKMLCVARIAALLYQVVWDAVNSGIDPRVHRESEG